jgi:hypothetical protein
MASACGDEPVFATGGGPAADAPSSCAEPTEVPAAVVETLSLDEAFYAKHCAVFGIDVLASRRVPDMAMEVAGRMLQGVLEDDPDLRDALHDRYFRVVLVAASAGEELRDVPELGGISSRENAAAGIGPDPAFPAATIRDSAILCRPPEQDALATPPGDTLLHELGHALLSMGLVETTPDFRDRLDEAFSAARADGRWEIRVLPAADLLFGPLPSDNYLMSNAEEYWATGVSAWLGFKPIPIAYALTDDDPPRLQLQVIYGRDSITDVDPALAELLTEVLGPSPELRHHCPAWIPASSP